MSDERLRELERAAASGDPVAVERYLVEKIRVSPDLTTKLVRRLIRVERVIVAARANEDELFEPVTTDEFLAFLEQESPVRRTEPGRLQIEGQDPQHPGGPRGGHVRIEGGQVFIEGPHLDAPPTNAQLHAMILALQERVATLEANA